jgi:rRNA methylases
MTFSGCVDLWEPKVIRSGAGAHFRIPIVSDVEWDELETHVGGDASVFLADNSEHVWEDISKSEGEEEEEEEGGGDDTDNGDESQLQVEENRTKCSPGVSKYLEIYKRKLSSIAVVPYFAVDYTNQSSVVLVIGGETEGLSINAFRLAHDRYGIRLNVPLSNNVESLNSGTALGIIVFEMKRQFLKKIKCKSWEDISEEIERINAPNV